MAFDVNDVALRLYRSNTVWVVAWFGSVLIAAAVLSIMFWSWLSDGESNSTTIRNLSLVIAAIIGLPLAIWRSIVAERQADTAQLGLLNERYQKGAEMLGSEVLSVRLGGIYALARLSCEHPGAYHIQIMRLLCAFVRNPTKEFFEAPLPTNGLVNQPKFNSGCDEEVDKDDEDRTQRAREDVQAVVTVICTRSKAQIEIEQVEKYRLNLSRAFLADVSLAGANLFRADLSFANLTGAGLEEANLMYTNLMEANLTSAVLCDANMDGAWLRAANLTGVEMSSCTGLTQRGLDLAMADSDRLPILENAVDAETGKPLVWRGASPSG